MKIAITITIMAAALLATAQAASAQTYMGLMGMQSVKAKPGVAVGIIDTAFNPMPFSGSGRTIVVGTKSSGHDDHGTYMNSSISSAWNGTAPGTRVIAYSCGSLGGMVDVLCAEAAMRALIRGGKVRVISLSFSYDGAVPQDFVNSWKVLAQEATKRRVLVLASAGEGRTVGFPANVGGGIISVGTVSAFNRPLPPANVLVRAPKYGVMTYTSCMCDAAVSGVSYSTAWAAGISSRLMKEGAAYWPLRRALVSTPKRSINYIILRRKLGLSMM